jgi:signal transduction histidine kinase
VTSRGLAVIDTSMPEKADPAIHSHIERIVVDDTILHWPAGELIVPPRTSRIVIDYGAASLAEGSRLRFSYKLEGFDDHWVEAGALREALYQRLPSGHYRFLMRTSLNGREQSQAALAFVVQPTFFETRWFYVLCLVGVASVAAGMWQVRVRSLRQQFRVVLDERTRIAREIHDTLLQNIAGVALELEGLAMDGPSSASTEELRHLRRRLERTIADARRSILELRSSTLDKLPLENALKEFAGQFGGTDKPHVTVAVSGDRRQFPRNAEEQLLRIGQEAIRNAARHGHANRVDVRLSYEPDALRLCVSDDGRGFIGVEGMSDHTDQWGLKGMQERISSVGGRLHVTTGDGKGTEVEAWVPAQ